MLNHQLELFPSRWIGGLSLIIAPVLMLVAELLRVQYSFFFPAQLQAFWDHPIQMNWSYGLFLSGNILLFPGIITLVNLIGVNKPNWARWAGLLVILGLFARSFHYGVNHLAFQLVQLEGVEEASRIIGDSYGSFHVVSVLTAAVMFGWVVLGIGAYISKVLDLKASIGVGLMSGLMLGVLKGSTYFSIFCIAALCFALVPLGIRVIKAGPAVPTILIFKWVLIIVATLFLMYVFGQAG